MPPSSGFPKGWKFIIDPEIAHYHADRAPMKCLEGLKLLPPDRVTGYYSVEAAQRRMGQVLKDVIAEKFYAHLGAISSSAKAPKRNALPDNLISRQSPMTLEELLKYGCGECVNCDKDDCGLCASCLSNGVSRRRVCIQKVSWNLFVVSQLLDSLMHCHFLCHVNRCAVKCR